MYAPVSLLYKAHKITSPGAHQEFFTGRGSLTLRLYILHVCLINYAVKSCHKNNCKITLFVTVCIYTQAQLHVWWHTHIIWITRFKSPCFFISFKISQVSNVIFQNSNVTLTSIRRVNHVKRLILTCLQNLCFLNWGLGWGCSLAAPSPSLGAPLQHIMETSCLFIFVNFNSETTEDYLIHTPTHAHIYII